ncbi:HAD-like domain-containing protein [Melampsora americana]|nr:HAD-like domain-containing protein [Melampsora americana]
MSPSTLSHANAKFIVFSDFDGTITTEDSNDHMTDNLGFGREKRRQGNLDVLEGKVTFRDMFKEMIDSVSSKYSFDECREIVKKHIKLDPGFKEFLDWARSANVPVVIVSSGMVPIIRAIFENLVGGEAAAQIEIVANDVDLSKGSGPGEWTIKYRHPESGFGHDKDKCIEPYRSLSPKPTLFFCGDGVSDLSAARSADCLFVKVKEGTGNDLSKHCQREKIRHFTFESFLQVKEVVEGVVKGDLKAEEVGGV